MTWLILIETTGEGSIESVGVKEMSPSDRLNIRIIPPAPVLYPSPEILQALKELIVQAKREDQD